MPDIVHTEIYRGHKIEIKYESDPFNPREDTDYRSKMLCWHGRYNLGDPNRYSTPMAAVSDIVGYDIEDEDAPEQNMWAALNAADIVWEPLYLYDHSGITMSTHPFSCPWDSGQVGFIYLTYKDMWYMYAGSHNKPPLDWKPDENLIKRAEADLRTEVDVYDRYLRNEVYYYTVYEPSGKEGVSKDDDDYWLEIASCGGYYEDYDREGGCLDQARAEVPRPEAMVMVFHEDGTVEFTRSPRLYDFFQGAGDMERISEIRKDEDGYFIDWLRGPYPGPHDMSVLQEYVPNADLRNALIIEELEDDVIVAEIPHWKTYEEAVGHEIVVLNAMRRRGVSFI